MKSIVNLRQKIAGTRWSSNSKIPKAVVLALVYSTVKHCAPLRLNSSHRYWQNSTQLNSAMRVIIGYLKATWGLPVIAKILLPKPERKKAW